jgi:hypothetical protein
MNSDTEAIPPVWGSATQQPEPWSKHRILVAVGIAAALSAVGAVVIHAADGSSTAHNGPGAGTGWGPPGGVGGSNGGGPMGTGAAVAGMGDALHGEFVVPDDNGRYRTQLTQTGTVTDISDPAVTARSADGYTRTYVITTDTRRGPDPVKAGDSATIRAVEDNGVNAATVIAPAR